jgi:hypothetical protein
MPGVNLALAEVPFRDREDFAVRADWRIHDHEGSGTARGTKSFAITLRAVAAWLRGQRKCQWGVL